MGLWLVFSQRPKATSYVIHSCNKYLLSIYSGSDFIWAWGYSGTQNNHGALIPVGGDAQKQMNRLLYSSNLHRLKSPR